MATTYMQNSREEDEQSLDNAAEGPLTSEERALQDENDSLFLSEDELRDYLFLPSEGQLRDSELRKNFKHPLDPNDKVWLAAYEEDIRNYDIFNVLYKRWYSGAQMIT
jgi:hypothetical protein